MLFLALTHSCVSHPASPCCMGETCLWSVTHAPCPTTWNHSPVPVCWSASRPGARLTVGAWGGFARHALSHGANLQMAAFSIWSGFQRGVFHLLVCRGGEGSNGIRGKEKGGQGRRWKLQRSDIKRENVYPRTRRRGPCSPLLVCIKHD